jgi:hypothetical protein
MMRIVLAGTLALAFLAEARATSSSWPDGEGICAGVSPGGADARGAAELRGAPPAPDRFEIEPGARDLQVLRWIGVEVDSVSEEIPLSVSAETVGITIRADSGSREHSIFVELFGPGGEVLACAECPDAPAVGDSQEGSGTTQMPSTDRPGWELSPGAYSFRVRATPIPEAGPRAKVVVDVTATLRSDIAVEVERFVDLNFVYLPGSSLSEEIAASSPQFATFLERFDQWMAPTGIRAGRVTHRDLDRPEFSFVDGWEEAGRMFRSTSREVGRPRTLNVYCVQGFVWDPPLPVIGLSGGIPGPVFNGTRDSGIALRTSPFFSCNDCVDAFAELFAHEIGHYLGFYHTTEANWQEADPLSDTPRCPEGTELGSCPDRFYIMFPLISPANTLWSPSQALIAKTHPLVQTVAVLGGRRPAPGAGGDRGAGRRLAIASPNPFRDVVRLELDRARPGAASASVYDLGGRLVRELAPATGELAWDGRDGSGRVLAAGTYFVRLRAGGATENVRIVKLK